MQRQYSFRCRLVRYYLLKTKQEEVRYFLDGTELVGLYIDSAMIALCVRDSCRRDMIAYTQVMSFAALVVAAKNLPQYGMGNSKGYVLAYISLIVTPKSMYNRK